MKDKFNLTREQNVFVAKRNIVDYIWKSANLEGIDVTYSETQAIYDGGIVNGLTVDNIIAINNLKYSWQFILENDEMAYDFNILCHLHKLTCDKLVLDQNLGRIRTTPVNIALVLEEFCIAGSIALGNTTCQNDAVVRRSCLQFVVLSHVDRLGRNALFCL